MHIVLYVCKADFKDSIFHSIFCPAPVTRKQQMALRAVHLTIYYSNTHLPPDTAR